MTNDMTTIAPHMMGCCPFGLFGLVAGFLSMAAPLGLSKAAAKGQGLNFDTHFKKTEGWYSSMRVGAKHSGYKVLVEQGTGRILGAHLIGPGSEEQINLFAMAMGAGLTANQIKAMIFAYPSFASDIGEMV